MHRATIDLTRGDKFSFAWTMTKAGFDFTGSTILAQVRALGDPDGASLAEADVTVDTGTVGTATAVASIEGSVTQGFPEKVVLEIEVSKSAASWGPHTIVRLTLNVGRDYAHA